MKESDIESKLTEGVKKAGGMCMKFVSPGFSGVPDRIILMPGGKVYFVETKRPGGDLKPLQEKVHSLFKVAGFDVHVIASKTDLQKFLHLL